MAEAHSAVAFSFAITHEGVNVNFDIEVLHLVWESGVRSWKKRLARFKNGVKSGVYPAPLHSLGVVVSIFAALYFSGLDITFGLVDKIVHFLPRLTFIWLFVSCAVSAFILWITIILIIRYTLKILLMYKGWMYEERGKGRKISQATRLWFCAVKMLSGWSTPMLYSFQGSLPRLPLPSLKETMERYLLSVRPLLDDQKYSRMESLATEFQNGIGKKLQRYLVLKSWWSSNYVSDWWEEYVYLRGRSPLMVNSNFYGMDAVFIHPTKIQAARAANIVYGALLFRRAIDRQELEPIMIQGLVPLCSWQYERVFNTTRVPGEETDTLVHYMDSTHIVVYHRGRYFKVLIHYKGRLLKPCEIELQLEKILSNETLPEKGEEKLAALTTESRATWAKLRAQYFHRGINRVSLDAIEKSAFVLALDEVEYEYDPNDESKLNFYGRMMLHGKGYDRWFDKSFTIVVGSNAKIGFNAEHSWADAALMSHLWEFTLSEDLEIGADAPVMGHLWEYCLAEEILNGYKPDGHTVGEPEFEPPGPMRLKWDLPQGCLEAIDMSYKGALSILNDVDLRLYVHDSYGKGFMKKCQVSPDAYIQMGLQLAYFRDSSRFSLTYEASMTRLYREGRTETVRPCTIESCIFVKSMEDHSISKEEKARLLQAACKVHQRAYQDAMCGKGIDRHLFCLYVVSKYLEVDSPFLKEVLSEPWRLSTSQTPHGQTAKLDLRKHPDCISCGGGFGPVADDGYGVSYIIAGENLMFFHVSSKKSSPETDSNRFAKQLERAFQDIRALFDMDGVAKMDGVGNNCHL